MPKEREQCGCHHAVPGGVSGCDAAFPDPPRKGGGGKTESVDPARTPKRPSNRRYARDTPQSAGGERSNSHQECSYAKIGETR